MKKNVRHVLSYILAIAFVLSLVLSSGLLAGTNPPQVKYFDQIATDGNGDPMNNYAWSVSQFKDSLYVGSGRNILYQVFLQLKAQGILPPTFNMDSITQPSGAIGSKKWAADMAAQIWRYDASGWTRVYRADVEDISGTGTVYGPRASGFRAMLTFTDRNGKNALYAANGSQLPAYSDDTSLLFKSTSGTAWRVVATPALGSDSRSMAIHEGFLCVGLSSAVGTKAQIWASNLPGDDPSTWQLIGDFTDSGNSAVVSMASFNGFLYAGTFNHTDGYQVWKGESTIVDDIMSVNWTKIVENGAGDKANMFAGTMKVFKNYLYVGSMSLPVVNGSYIPKGFELIRISTSDKYQLIIGDEEALLPPSKLSPVRVPLSGWTGGFGNLLNLYCWSLEELDGTLYLGTFDSSIILVELIKQGVAYQELTSKQRTVIRSSLKKVINQAETSGLTADVPKLQKVLAAYEDESLTLKEILDVLVQWFCGGDLWKSRNGVAWAPISLNGLGNPHNYGIRTLLNNGTGLYIGTANPFDGFDVFIGSTTKPE